MQYYSVNTYLKEKYKCKIYKLALKSGATCPNRDGKLGFGGCIFCSGGSGHFAEDKNTSVSEQIERAKALIKNKVDESTKYIAYFQDYSATYAPIDILRNNFTEAINHPDVAILSIATRPDCLPDEVLDLLKELNKIKPVWVELGLQTSNEETAQYIRRGYKNEVFEKAVTRLKELGIYTVAHLIIGLPNENEDTIYNTVRYVCDLGVDGIKYHLLHVLKNTDLETEYESGGFETLSLDKYCEILSGCIKRTDKRIAIHRLTGDGDKRLLIAPLWSADKKHVLNTINRYFEATNTVQGELVVEKSQQM